MRLVSLGRRPVPGHDRRSRPHALQPQGPAGHQPDARRRPRWRRRRRRAGRWRRTRIPIPGGTKAGGGIGCVLIIVVILVLKACGGIDLTGARPAARPAGYDTQPVQAGDRTAYENCQTGQDANDHPEPVAWSRSRTRWTTTGSTPCRSRRPARRSSPRPRSTPSRGRRRTGCGQASSAMGPFYCPSDQHHLLRPDLLPGHPPGAAERPVRRVRRALRRRPRVRPPHPEPPGHHGQGEDPAGPEQRLRAARAPGRLLRRHVGAGTPRTTQDSPGQRADRGPHRPGHPGGHRGGQVGRRRHASSRRRPAGSTPSSGRTARPPRASTGSPSGYQNGTLAACNTFNGQPVE